MVLEIPSAHLWYDYHWQRGTPWHYLDMMVLRDLCGRRNAIAGNYAAYSGLTEDLFTVNTCIASGVKMILWFIGGPMSRDTHEWIDDKELVPVAAEIRMLSRELMLIGNPSAYYSTLVTRTPEDRPVDPPAVPKWCRGLPPDGWLQVPSGEALIGLYKYADGTDALFVANQNAFAPQKMVLQFKPAEGKALAVEMFDRKDGTWRELSVRDNAVSFDLGEARGELLKIKGAASK